MALKTATSGSDAGGAATQLPGTEGAKREPMTQVEGGTLGPGVLGAAQRSAGTFPSSPDAHALITNQT